MAFNKQDEASFCKILLNNSAEYLPLPSAFAEEYLRRSNNNKISTLVIETRFAVTYWSVKYLKLEDRHYFLDGWLQFMKDNGLQVDDLLVFLLRSCSPNPVFQVFIYAPDGCLKDPNGGSGGFGALMLIDSHNSDDTAGKELCVAEEACYDDDDSSENVQMSGRKSYTSHVPLTKALEKATRISGYGSLRLKNDEVKMWKLEFTKYGMVKIPCLSVGWFEFMMDNQMKIGDSCEFSHVKANLLHVRFSRMTFEHVLIELITDVSN